MKDQLPRILSTMVGGTPAILRIKKENTIHSKMVEITDHNQSMVICCLQNGENLTSKEERVSLIIKNKLHYLHCSGKVDRLFLNGRVFTMELSTASLFIRKNNKESSWLEELYKFEEAEINP